MIKLEHACTKLRVCMHRKTVLYGAVRAIWSLVRYVCVTCINLPHASFAASDEVSTHAETSGSKNWPALTP